MAYKITDACVGCGLCAENCPVEAIKPVDGVYAIDESICVGCGLCERQCPVGAITKTDYTPEGHKLPSREIDPEKCIKCGLCQASCKIKAIDKE